MRNFGLTGRDHAEGHASRDPDPRCGDAELHSANLISLPRGSSGDAATSCGFGRTLFIQELAADTPIPAEHSLAGARGKKAPVSTSDDRELAAWCFVGCMLGAIAFLIWGISQVVQLGLVQLALD